MSHYVPSNDENCAPPLRENSFRRRHYTNSFSPEDSVFQGGSVKCTPQEDEPKTTGGSRFAEVTPAAAIDVPRASPGAPLRPRLRVALEANLMTPTHRRGGDESSRGCSGGLPDSACALGSQRRFAGDSPSSRWQPPKPRSATSRGGAIPIGSAPASVLLSPAGSLQRQRSVTRRMPNLLDSPLDSRSIRSRQHGSSGPPPQPHSINRFPVEVGGPLSSAASRSPMTQSARCPIASVPIRRCPAVPPTNGVSLLPLASRRGGWSCRATGFELPEEILQRSPPTAAAAVAMPSPLQCCTSAVPPSTRIMPPPSTTWRPPRTLKLPSVTSAAAAINLADQRKMEENWSPTAGAKVSNCSSVCLPPPSSSPAPAQSKLFSLSSRLLSDSGGGSETDGGNPSDGVCSSLAALASGLEMTRESLSSPSSSGAHVGVASAGEIFDEEDAATTTPEDHANTTEDASEINLDESAARDAALDEEEDYHEAAVQALRTGDASAVFRAESGSGEVLSSSDIRAMRGILFSPPSAPTFRPADVDDAALKETLATLRSLQSSLLTFLLTEAGVLRVVLPTDDTDRNRLPTSPSDLSAVQLHPCESDLLSFLQDRNAVASAARQFYSRFTQAWQAILAAVRRERDSLLEARAVLEQDRGLAQELKDKITHLDAKNAQLQRRLDDANEAAVAAEEEVECTKRLVRETQRQLGEALAQVANDMNHKVSLKKVAMRGAEMYGRVRQLDERQQHLEAEQNNVEHRRAQVLLEEKHVATVTGYLNIRETAIRVEAQQLKEAEQKLAESLVALRAKEESCVLTQAKEKSIHAQLQADKSQLAQIRQEVQKLLRTLEDLKEEILDTRNESATVVATQREMMEDIASKKKAVADFEARQKSIEDAVAANKEAFAEVEAQRKSVEAALAEAEARRKSVEAACAEAEARRKSLEAEIKEKREALAEEVNAKHEAIAEMREIAMYKEHELQQTRSKQEAARAELERRGEFASEMEERLIIREKELEEREKNIAKREAVGRCSCKASLEAECPPKLHGGNHHVGPGVPRRRSLEGDDTPSTTSAGSSCVQAAVRKFDEMIYPEVFEAIRALLSQPAKHQGYTKADGVALHRSVQKLVEAKTSLEKKVEILETEIVQKQGSKQESLVMPPTHVPPQLATRSSGLEAPRRRSNSRLPSYRDMRPSTDSACHRRLPSDGDQPTFKQPTESSLRRKSSVKTDSRQRSSIS